MVLLGTEIKSLRDGRGSFNDSYCIIDKGEVWLKSLHISPYSHGTVNNHDPDRDRKLLLQKREIRRIQAKLKEKGYTLDGARIALTTNSKISETVSMIDRLEFVKAELQKLKESLTERPE